MATQVRRSTSNRVTLNAKFSPGVFKGHLQAHSVLLPTMWLPPPKDEPNLEKPHRFRNCIEYFLVHIHHTPNRHGNRRDHFKSQQLRQLHNNLPGNTPRSFPNHTNQPNFSWPQNQSTSSKTTPNWSTSSKRSTNSGQSTKFRNVPRRTIAKIWSCFI